MCSGARPPFCRSKGGVSVSVDGEGEREGGREKTYDRVFVETSEVRLKVGWDPRREEEGVHGWKERLAGREVVGHGLPGHGKIGQRVDVR